jgi:F-type H+-transporting ATPase subunit b
VAGAEHASGLPQFNTDYWPGQVVWVLIIFAVLLALMSRVFVPKIGGAVEGREATIEGDIAEARRLKVEADAKAEEAAAQTAQARAAAQRVALEARTKAQAEIAAKLTAEEARLAETTAAAEGRIAAAREQAMSNVRTIAADTAQAIVEKLTGKAASAGELDALRKA